MNQKVVEEQKKKIKQLEAIIQSKEDASSAQTQRFNTLQLSMKIIKDDLKSGKLKQLTSYEMKALKEYPVIVMQQGALRVQYEELQRQQSQMMTKKEEMQGQLARLQGDPSKLCSMDSEALKQLRSELQRSIKNVEEAEEELESQRNCVMCMDNRKNVCFDGCDHMAVCQDCIGDLIPKQCPVCRAPFRTSRVMRM